MMQWVWISRYASEESFRALAAESPIVQPQLEHRGRAIQSGRARAGIDDRPLG